MVLKKRIAGRSLASLLFETTHMHQSRDWRFRVDQILVFVLSATFSSTPHSCFFIATIATHCPSYIVHSACAANSFPGGSRHVPPPAQAHRPPPSFRHPPPPASSRAAHPYQQQTGSRGGHDERGQWTGKLFVKNAKGSEPVCEVSMSAKGMQK